MAAIAETSRCRIDELSARVVASILQSLGTAGAPLSKPFLAAASARGLGDLGC